MRVFLVMCVPGTLQPNGFNNFTKQPWPSPHPYVLPLQCIYAFNVLVGLGRWDGGQVLGWWGAPVPLALGYGLGMCVPHVYIQSSSAFLCVVYGLAVW